MNLGAWRLRADWRLIICIVKAMMTMLSTVMTRKKLGVEPLLRLAGLTVAKSQLGLGEDYLNSDIFDGFNYVVAVSAPTIKCCRRICAAMRRYLRRGAHHRESDRQPDGPRDYETQVPAGPFRIQDLGDSVSVRCISALKSRTVRCRNMTLHCVNAVPDPPRPGAL